MTLDPVNIIAFVAILGTMVVAHEMGHFIIAKRAGIRVDEFGIGYPPRLFAIKRGETLYSLNLVPLGGFCRMLGEEDPTQDRSFARARKRWRTLILVAGPAMNLVLAVILFAASFMAGWPTAVSSEVVIAAIQSDSPAQSAGLLPGDIVTQVVGRQVSSMQDIRDAARALAGRDMALEVRRNGNPVTVVVQPRNDGPHAGTIGVSLAERALKMARVSYPPQEALVKGVRQTVEIVALTFYVPVLAIRGQVPAESVRPVGPVGIYDVVSQATSETVSRNWWFPLLSTTALLSTGLGIANLLPIPGLDGGRLLFIAIEAIRRKRVSPEREGFIHLVGIAFLLSMVVLVSYFDVLAPIGAIDWGP